MRIGSEEGVVLGHVCSSTAVSRVPYLISSCCFAVVDRMYQAKRYWS